jgi:hypothetical protein
MGMAAFLSREQTARKRIANSGENLIDTANPGIDREKHCFRVPFRYVSFGFWPHSSPAVFFPSGPGGMSPASGVLQRAEFDHRWFGISK